MHVAGIALLGALSLLPDYSLGDLMHKARDRLGDRHPTVSGILDAAIHVTGLQPARKHAISLTLPPFPGPAAWPAHGTVADGFMRITYSGAGAPQQAPAGPFTTNALDNKVYVNNEKALIKALREAKPGDIITLAPGIYRFSQRRLSLGGSGLLGRPVYLRSERLGDVRIELNSLEGFFVDRPYWVFENLVIHGTCSNDSHCEHAFHVVGRAIGTVLRNNELIDFNAPLKVNSLSTDTGDQFPDRGLVQNNTIYNTRVRETGNPVTLLNINAADSWVVSANFIADFAKGRSNRISYEAFMKSNSSNGIFERNLVVCHWRLPPMGGVRVGLSFGGGGSSTSASRNRDNSTEHTGGIIRNNIIARCPLDVGIYLNKASRTQIHNNLLFGTTGIDVRFDTSSASIHNNILDGRIRDRDGGTHTADNNLVESACGLLSRLFSECGSESWYFNALAGDLRLVAIDQLIDKGNAEPHGELDFCGNRRTRQGDLGPIEYGAAPLCLPNL